MLADDLTEYVVRQWLQKADEDFLASLYLLRSQSQLYATVCFHTQQCVEKVIKAILLYNRTRFPHTHDITELLDLLNNTQPILADSLRITTGLYPYAINTRYPTEEPAFSIEEAKSSLEITVEARTKIRKYLQDNKFPFQFHDQDETR